MKTSQPRATPVRSPAPGEHRFRQRVEHWVPGARVLRTYRRAWLPRDLIARLVLSALLVPQGMAYAELAGLPPITGLYTTVVALLAYAALGPSPFLVLGPDSSLGPMIAAAILPLAVGNEEPTIALAGMLAMLVGLVCVGAGIAKLGCILSLQLHVATLITQRGEGPAFVTLVVRSWWHKRTRAADRRSLRSATKRSLSRPSRRASGSRKP